MYIPEPRVLPPLLHHFIQDHASSHGHILIYPPLLILRPTVGLVTHALFGLPAETVAERHSYPAAVLGAGVKSGDMINTDGFVVPHQRMKYIIRFQANRALVL